MNDKIEAALAVLDEVTTHHGMAQARATLAQHIADLTADNARLWEALNDALKTAAYEKHPYRAWHNAARAALKEQAP